MSKASIRVSFLFGGCEVVFAWRPLTLVWPLRLSVFFSGLGALFGSCGLRLNLVGGLFWCGFCCFFCLGWMVGMVINLLHVTCLVAFVGFLSWWLGWFALARKVVSKSNLEAVSSLAIAVLLDS